MASSNDVLKEFLERYTANADMLFRALTKPGLHTLERPTHGTVLCEKGDEASAFWLIVEGQVDVYDGVGAPIRSRCRGELVGEQAFLLAQTPCMNGHDSKGPGRTARLVTHGPTVLLRFDAALTEKLSGDERALWSELLAHVTNVKLAQATSQRAEQASQVDYRDRLLARFCDKTALGVVQAVVDGSQPLTPIRDVIVWFSDVAGFSGWSRGRDASKVAEAAKLLLGLQVKLIREHGGEIDKLMGDGLMAYWFYDGPHRSGVPKDVYLCAKRVIREFEKAIAEKGLGDLTLRVGLHTGPACFGDFGTEDRVAVTVLGETINVGSRYEQLRAHPELCPNLGPIRMSKELHDLVSAIGGAAELNGPIEATVKEDKIVVYWAEGGSDGLE